MSKYLEQELISVGLSPKEAKVYMALLKMGRGTAYKIALVAGIKIPTTYLALDELYKKGLVIKSVQKKSTVYFVQKPDTYIREQKNKILNVERLLPEFNSLLEFDNNSRTISFDGYDGIIQALEYRYDELKGRVIYSLYSHLPNLDKKILEAYIKWGKKAIADNLSFKILIPKTPNMDIYIKHRVEMYENNTKIINASLWQPDGSIEIIDDLFVRIISPIDLQATIIENKHITRTMKQLFMMLWNNKDAVEYK